MLKCVFCVSVAFFLELVRDCDFWRKQYLLCQTSTYLGISFEIFQNAVGLSMSSTYLQFRMVVVLLQLICKDFENTLICSLAF